MGASSTPLSLHFCVFLKFWKVKRKQKKEEEKEEEEGAVILVVPLKVKPCTFIIVNMCFAFSLWEAPVRASWKHCNSCKEHTTSLRKRCREAKTQWKAWPLDCWWPDRRRDGCTETRTKNGLLEHRPTSQTTSAVGRETDELLQRVGEEIAAAAYTVLFSKVSGGHLGK